MELMVWGRSGLDIPISSNKHSSTELFPELFCPRKILTREKSSIFRWSMPLKFLISMFLKPSIAAFYSFIIYYMQSAKLLFFLDFLDFFLLVFVFLFGRVAMGLVAVRG